MTTSPENRLIAALSRVTEEQFRSNIERIIKSYRHTWDIYAELLQNAVDAIIEQFPTDSNGKGKVFLAIDTAKREVIVKDNGVGIPAEKLVSVLVNGESLKRQNGTGKYGFMGFGLTFVAFQSSYISISTVHNKVKASITYRDLYKSVFDKGTIPQSEEEANGVKPMSTEEAPGTTVTIRFPDVFPEETIEQILKSTFAYPKQKLLFETVLRTRTVVGCTNPLFGELPLFAFELKVDGAAREVEAKFLGVREVVKRTLHSVQAFYDIDTEYPDVLKISEKMSESQRDSARKANLLDGFYKSQTIGINGGLMARIQISATSKEHLNKFNQEINTPNDSNASLEYRNGVWLAIDGMPTGICLDLYEHSNYLPYTALVDVTSRAIRKDLDAGRKGITDYRARQICQLVFELLRDHQFLAHRRYVVGADSRISDPLYNPKSELQHLLSGKSEYVIKLCNRWLPPREEQEVIALFVELLSREMILGYTPQVLSGYQVYDGLYSYSLEKKPETVFSVKNPLGIADKIFDHKGGKLKKDDLLIEFKSNLFGLVADIDRHKKDISHIDILVVWDEQSHLKEELLNTKGCILRERDITKNPFYGVTHELLGLGRQNPLPIVSLRSITKEAFRDAVKDL
jgi:hypothetical protein